MREARPLVAVARNQEEFMTKTAVNLIALT